MSSPPQQGYDASFVDAVPDEYNCVVCHLVLRQPVQLMGCGHRYCATCYQQLLTHTQHLNTPLVCPVDRLVVTSKEVFPDRGMERMIGNLKVKCGNSHLGCLWSDDLRDLSEHELQCEYLTKELMAQSEKESSTENSVFKAFMEEVTSRLSKCEEDIALKDKEIARLKFALEDMKDDHQKQMDALQVEMRRLLSNFQRENEGLIKPLVTKGTLDTGENGREPVAGETKVEKVDNVAKSKNTVAEEDQVAQALTIVGHIHHDRCDSSSQYKVDWLVPNIWHYAQHGLEVFSPLFSAEIEGYCFKLHIEFSGTMKENLGVILQLHRDKNFCGSLPAFNYEYTFSAKNSFGKCATETITREDIALFDNCFTIPKGIDVAEGLGEILLKAPSDDYIEDDTLTVSCIFGAELS